MFKLSNDLLEVTINPVGAEMQKITAVHNALEFMWDGNPNIWTGHAPNLFPIIGTLKDGVFIYDAKDYHLSRHGFARHSTAFSVEEKDKQRLTLKLVYSEETLEDYPFKFEFSVTYELIDNRIKVTYHIKNVDDKTLYFSVGAHPAFRCPIYPDETYDDYLLKFEHPETSPTHLLNLENGLLTSKTEPVFTTPDAIALNYNLFDKDALVFKDLKSRKVSLESKKHGEILSVSFNDFPYLGIWAKPNANFVCIEPWHGVSDSEDSNQILKDKEGILTLEKNKSFTASYHIEIHKAHLA